MTSESYIEIRKAIALIIKGTEWEGHVYLVGGCVRDEIMGLNIHDIDLAIDLPNGGIRFVQWLAENHFTPKGRKPKIFEHFGTAKVRLKAFPKEEIDCVQTRKERYVYEEVPNPDKYFGNIEEDALCRDLTINTLFRNITTDELIDPLGKGLHDIENHIIRTPNDPDISLRDNAMHILRCIRFAVKYNWVLSSELLESMQRNVDIVATATTRRMINELLAILNLKEKKRALSLISKVGAMPVVEPYLQMIQKKRAEMAERDRKRKEKEKNKSQKEEEGKRPKKKRRKSKGKGKKKVQVKSL